MEKFRTDLFENQEDEKKKWQAPRLKKTAQEKGTDNGGSSNTDGGLFS